MTAQQQSAISQLRDYITRASGAGGNTPLVVTKFETEETAYGTVWVKAEREIICLPDGNYLRAVSHEYWLTEIGQKGKITVKMAPHAYKQFNKKRISGMSFSLS